MGDLGGGRGDVGLMEEHVELATSRFCLEYVREWGCGRRPGHVNSHVSHTHPSLPCRLDLLYTRARFV
jgi:hypothetical protein